MASIGEMPSWWFSRFRGCYPRTHEKMGLLVVISKSSSLRGLKEAYEIHRYRGSLSLQFLETPALTSSHNWNRCISRLERVGDIGMEIRICTRVMRGKYSQASKVALLIL